MGAIMKTLGAELQAKHPSVGAVRSIGLFGIVELIRDRKTRQPMAPFNGTSEEMVALGKFFRENGLYTFVRWNTFFTNPPLCINEQQLREAFAIIDKGLEITDRAVGALGLGKHAAGIQLPRKLGRCAGPATSSASCAAGRRREKLSRLVVRFGGVIVDCGGGLGAKVSGFRVELERADAVGAMRAGELHAALMRSIR
jgi:hypothetical protein